MALSISKSKGQQVRDDYRAERVKRLVASRQAEVLLPPGFPNGAIVDATDGTLNKDFLKAALPVAVSAWNDLPPNDKRFAHVDVEWASAAADGSAPDPSTYVSVDGRDVPGPLGPDAFPLMFEVPLTTLVVDGRYYLRLAMAPYTGGGKLYSLPVPITCDSEGPYVHATPVVMGLIPNQVIDSSFVPDDEVVGGIPEYPDYQPGDQVAFFWAQPPFPEDWSGMVPINTVAPDGTTWPFPVSYPGVEIRTKGDGVWYPVYGLVDKATNPSKLSAQKGVNVALGALPSGLQAPEVPLAQDDGLVSLKDAIAGVTVRILDFVNHKPTDLIIITWGTSQLAAVPIGLGDFPMDIPVAAGVLEANYGAATGAIATDVSYVISRGGVLSAPQATSVQVDFSTIGPPNPDPDWPNPVNPNLPLAAVYGKTNPTLNVLDRTNENEPADVRLELYNPLKPDEIIDFYWKGALVTEAQYVVKVADSAGDVITVEIPWRYIKEGFNDPKLPVHYRIRASADPEDNEQHSSNTEVNANAVTPVGPAAAFLGEVTSPGNVKFLICESLYDTPPHADDPAIRVQVPDLSGPPFNLAAGAILRMSWRVAGYPDDNPITSVSFDEDITLDVDHPATGFVWRVTPYANYIEPIYIEGPQDGTATVTYTFEFNSETVSSIPVEGNVAMHTGAGPCPIPPPRKG